MTNPREDRAPLEQRQDDQQRQHATEDDLLRQVAQRIDHEIGLRGHQRHGEAGELLLQLRSALGEALRDGHGVDERR